MKVKMMRGARIWASLKWPRVLDASFTGALCNRLFCALCVHRECEGAIFRACPRGIEVCPRLLV